MSQATTFEYCQEWLADNRTFRVDVCGLVRVSDARERIFREEVLESPDELQSERHTPDAVALVERPFCIVVTGEDSRRRAGTGTWEGEGTLLLVFELSVPEEHLVDWEQDAAEIRRVFAGRKAWGENLLQTMRRELMQSSGRSGASGKPFLNALRIDRYLSPADPELGEPQDYIGFALEVGWK